mmetsp:Transcript_45676/g.40914  ORF Transcript_45676/g.40914 Transcript_45676/m.40914 type:complete len:236 (-) Transcript_45676:317-1024(-)
MAELNNKFISDTCKLCVFGYIQGLNAEWTLMIPTEIKFLCFKFLQVLPMERNYTKLQRYLKKHKMDVPAIDLYLTFNGLEHEQFELFVKQKIDLFKIDPLNINTNQLLSMHSTSRLLNKYQHNSCKLYLLLKYLLGYLTCAAVYKLDSKTKWINVAKGTIKVTKNTAKKGYIITCESSQKIYEYRWKSTKYKIKQTAFITKAIDNENNESNIYAFRFHQSKSIQQFKSHVDQISS